MQAKFFRFTITATLLFTLTIAIHADFSVKVIYFQPKNTPEAPVEKIRETMTSTQEFFANEMQRHKFSRKTFQLEHVANKVKVPTIKGRYSANHYKERTIETLKDELPVSLKDNNNILIVFLGGLKGVAGRYNGQGSTHFGHDCGGCKGLAIIASKNGNFLLSTVAHELGHTFGLYHNLAGKNGENFLMWFDGVLDFHEARLLNKSPYFNTNNHIIQTPPQILKPSPPKLINDLVYFSAKFYSNQGLYQAQIFRDTDHAVLDWARLNGQNDSTTFQIQKSELINESRVWIQVIDNNGNQSILPVDFTLQEQKSSTNLHTGEITYLTLTYKAPNAITPINPKTEWDGWIGGEWEKYPDGTLQPRPNVYMNPEKHIPYIKEWDHFFYLHAKSHILYDISNQNYSAFNTYFFLPNPCGNIASVEIICSTDNIEIYNSGILRGIEAQNINISFKIPQNTKEFQIQVTDGADGNACDHFIFGNPRLFISESRILFHADVNNDGYIDLSDVMIVRSGIKHSNSYDTDVNHDGTTDETDLRIVKEQAHAAIAAAAPSLKRRRIVTTTWGALKKR